MALALKKFFKISSRFKNDDVSTLSLIFISGCKSGFLLLIQFLKIQIRIIIIERILILKRKMKNIIRMKVEKYLENKITGCLYYH